MTDFSTAFKTLDELGSDYTSMLIYGYQGTGKTFLASTMANVGKTLYVDLPGEKGVRSFQGAPWADNIVVYRPESVTDLDDLYWYLAKGDHEFKAVVLDSLTSAQKLAMRFLQNYDETVVREIKRGVAPPDMRVWGQSLEIMNDICGYWCGLADASRNRPMHVVLTAQVKTIENEVEGIVERLPDVQKGAVSASLASPDYVVYTQVEDNPEVEDGVLYTARIGPGGGYRTKGRIPYLLQGKLPTVLGRSGKATDLTTLGRVLGVGGIPALPTAPAPTTEPINPLNSTDSAEENA